MLILLDPLRNSKIGGRLFSAPRDRLQSHHDAVGYPWTKQYILSHTLTAQFSDRTSACSKTVRVACSCLSGG